jgi:mannitol/fructose-specific phosphotransferase system IIA component (Ntr-type)
MSEKLIGYLRTDALVLDMTAASKEGAIRELVQVVVDHGDVSADDQESVVQAVLAREERGSTGLGEGIAIPHVRDCEHVTGLTGAFGRSSSGIPFDAIDGNPVDLVFLILGGSDTNDEHIKILQGLASLRQNPHFLRFLRDAADEEAVVDVIKEMSGALS